MNIIQLLSLYSFITNTTQRRNTEKQILFLYLTTSKIIKDVLQGEINCALWQITSAASNSGKVSVTVHNSFTNDG